MKKRHHIFLLTLSLFSTAKTTNNNMQKIITWLSEDYPKHITSTILETKLKKLQKTNNIQNQFRTIHKPIALNSIFAHKNRITALTANNTKKILVTAAADETIKIWNLPNLKLLNTIYLPKDTTISSLAISNNGNLIAYSTSKNKGEIWHKLGIKICTLNGFVGKFMSSAYSQDDSLLLGTSNKGAICLWSTTTGKLSKTIPCHNNFIASAEFDQTYKKIITASHDETVQIFDYKKNKPAGFLKNGHDHWIKQASSNNKNNQIITCSYDETIGIWCTTTGKLLKKIIAHPKFWIDAIQWSPDGSLFFSTGTNGEIKIWNPTQKNPLYCSIKNTDSKAVKVTFLYNNKEIIYGNNHGRLHHIRITEKLTGEEFLLFKAFEKTNLKNLKINKPFLSRLTGRADSYGEKIIHRINSKHPNLLPQTLW